MPRLPDQAAILFRWTLEAPAWDACARAIRAHPHRSSLKLRGGSEADRTVTVTEDEIHVGPERIDLKSFHVHEVVEHGTWLRLLELDPDYLACPLPLPQDDAALGTQVLDHFRALAARHTSESTRRAEQAEAERRRPTPANRMLWFVERHFIACLLVLFFVVLPLGSVLVAWLAGRLDVAS